MLPLPPLALLQTRLATSSRLPHRTASRTQVARPSGYVWSASAVVADWVPAQVDYWMLMEKMRTPKVSVEKRARAAKAARVVKLGMFGVDRLFGSQRYDCFLPLELS